MFKLALGAVAGAVAMFLAGFLYFAGPLAMLGYGSVTEAQSATVQTALASNLTETGTYMIPDPSTQAGTILFGKGPVATVHYNSNGFSLSSLDSIIWGFGLYLVVAILIAAALSQLADRVTDFRSRAAVVICFSLATSVMLTLGDPIWLHQDWAYAIFGFIGNALMLIIAGLIIARWFLPKGTEPIVTPLPVEPTQESTGI